MLNAATGLTTISGTSHAGDIVSVYDKGPVLIGTATVASDGTWKLTAGISGDGVHGYIARSTDVAGNTGNSDGHLLYSAAGHHSLDGGAGNDVLVAGPGDAMSGGAGADTFVFNAGFGTAKVRDFDVNSDVLRFDHTLFGSAAQVLENAHDTAAGAVITVHVDESVTLSGVHVADLQSHVSDFHIV